MITKAVLNLGGIILHPVFFFSLLKKSNWLYNEKQREGLIMACGVLTS